MRKLFYPSLFHKAEEGGFWVTFPDFPECFTQGDDMQQAYEMSIEALGLAIISRKESGEAIPQPSQPDAIVIDPGSYLTVIEFDMEAYNKRNHSKAIKKTLTIPEWLNEEAIAMGINFSQTLQEALVSKIQTRL